MGGAFSLPQSAPVTQGLLSLSSAKQLFLQSSQAQYYVGVSSARMRMMAGALKALPGEKMDARCSPASGQDWI